MPRSDPRGLRQHHDRSGGGSETAGSPVLTTAVCADTDVHVLQVSLRELSADLSGHQPLQKKRLRPFETGAFEPIRQNIGILKISLCLSLSVSVSVSVSLSLSVDSSLLWISLKRINVFFINVSHSASEIGPAV